MHVCKQVVVTCSYSFKRVFLDGMMVSIMVMIAWTSGTHPTDLRSLDVDVLGPMHLLKRTSTHVYCITSHVCIRNYHGHI